MYTFVNLQKIIDTLPLYEKNKLEIKGAENVNVCLEDIWSTMLDYEKKEFIENNADTIATECSGVVSFSNYIIDDSSDIEKLSSMDDETIISYMEDQGYIVDEYFIR